MQIEQQSHRVIVTMEEPNLTAPEMEELVDDLGRIMRHDNATQFIFDMASVDFISSACLGALVGFVQDLEHVRGKLVLAGCKPDVAFIFKVTKLDNVFPMYEDVDEALDDL